MDQARGIFPACPEKVAREKPFSFGSNSMRARAGLFGIIIIISQVQYDPTFLQDWAEEMELRGFNMVVFYQTYGNYTQPCIRMENKMEQTADEDVENVVGSYNCLGNPMWRWMARNYREKYQGDRRMPAKPNNPGSVRKIDGMVTFVICEDGLMDIPDKPPVSPEPTFI